MISIIMLLFSFNVSTTNIEAESSCNCTSIAENVQNAKSANATVMAYADFQIYQLEKLGKAIDGFLSSGHTTGSNVKSYKSASATVKLGIKDLKQKKAEVSKASIKNFESYKAALTKVSNAGSEYYFKATKLIMPNTKGKGEITANGDISEFPECIRVGSSMKQACLRGIQKMSDCGIYAVLGLDKMRQDQDACDGKGAAAMALCAASNGAYSGEWDMDDENIKADQMCNEHEKVIGGGSQLQTQTWDGY